MKKRVQWKRLPVALGIVGFSRKTKTMRKRDRTAYGTVSSITEKQLQLPVLMGGISFSTGIVKSEDFNVPSTIKATVYFRVAFIAVSAVQNYRYPIRAFSILARFPHCMRCSYARLSKTPAQWRHMRLRRNQQASECSLRHHNPAREAHSGSPR